MENRTCPSCVLVNFESNVEHFGSLVALLVDELVAYLKQPREACLDDLVKLYPAAVSGTLESIGTANHEQALQAGENGRSVV